MKIEEGCLAVVIKSTAGNEWKSVTVGKFLGKVFKYEGDDMWEVDKPLGVVNSLSGVKRREYLCPENNLMRIDGFKESEEETYIAELLECEQ